MTKKDQNKNKEQKEEELDSSNINLKKEALNNGNETPKSEESEITDAELDEAEQSSADDQGAEPTYEELQEQVTNLKDQLLRSLAEGENIRRRTEREKADISKYAITNFARQIISVADNLTRAIGSVKKEKIEKNEDLKSLFVGIEMTEKELINSFEQFNIMPIVSIGEQFDHNNHQAMFEVDDPNKPAGTVVEEVQKGYILHDRLLRPAMVGVSKGGAKPDVIGSPSSENDTPREKTASDTSLAYEKQADAADQVGDGTNAQLDKKL